MEPIVKKIAIKYPRSYMYMLCAIFLVHIVAYIILDTLLQSFGSILLMIKRYLKIFSSPFEPLFMVNPHGLKNAEIFLVSLWKAKGPLKGRFGHLPILLFLTSKQNVNSVQTYQNISWKNCWKEGTIGLLTNFREFFHYLMICTISILVEKRPCLSFILRWIQCKWK